MFDIDKVNPDKNAMSFPPAGARILVTGGCGFLGRHVVSVLRSRHSVAPFDLGNPTGDPEAVEGSVTDPKSVANALENRDGLVIAHMAPRSPGMYDHPEIPLAVNVGGTASLLEAALRCGLRRVVLVSSVAVVHKALLRKEFLSASTPDCPDSIYGLSKMLQEQTAKYYHYQNGLEIAILRPAYVSLGDTLEDKYGIRRPSVNWQFIDPRDIGRAILGAFAMKSLGCETFYLASGPGASERADISAAMERLGWQPEFRFAEFPLD